MSFGSGCLLELCLGGSAGLFIGGCPAGFGRAARGRPSAGAHPSGVAGQPSCAGKRPSQQELDLGVGAAQFVGGPSGQGVMDGGIQPQQHALALAHRGSVPVVTGKGSRC